MKQGFFDLGVSFTPAPQKKKLNLGKGCDSCQLQHKCKSPRMKPQGEGGKKILIIGESPSPTDDRSNEYWAGSGSKLLWGTAEDLGFNLDKDAWFVNAVSCYTKDLKDNQLKNCKQNLLRVVKELKPKLIICLGSKAMQGLISHRISGRLKNTKYQTFMGETIPDQELKAWVCPTYSPYYINKIRFPHFEKRQFKKDLAKALKLWDVKRPWIPDEVHFTQNREKAIEWILKALKEAKEVAYDYETTGLKPHRAGHKIVTASIAYGDDGDEQGYAFPFFQDDEFRKAWAKLMRSKKVPKIAHKLDFENGWTYFRGGMTGMPYWVENYSWDTCLGSKVIHNKKPTSLKFNVYTKLGILGFDDEVDGYITKPFEFEDPKSGNCFVKTEECPLDTLLEYNAYDSLYTLLLKKIQEKEILPRQREVLLTHTIPGQIGLAEVQSEGFCLDKKKAEEVHQELLGNKEKVDQAILNHKDMEKWPNADKNIGSDTVLQKFLYDIMKYPAGRNGRKVDAEALKEIGSELCLLILESRRLEKIINTYLGQYFREEINGKIRAFFNLHITDTFRSSSDSPNFQNVPKRDPDAKKATRSTLIPEPGNRVRGDDYSGVEVCVSACHHKDKNMIKYIKDPSTNMHTDTACDMFFRTKETFLGTERQAAKNGFVFPAFYGSSTKPMKDQTIGNATYGIWKQIGDDTKEHLKENGIRGIKDFQGHIEEVERIFWEERFPEYNDWKTDMNNFYKRHGYLESLTGYRFQGPMKFTQIINAPIQSDAFQIMLFLLTNARKPIKEISGRSYIYGQVHDEVKTNMHPDDEEETDRLLKKWGIEEVNNQFPWLIVPLTLDKEMSEIDGNEAEMKEYEYLV